MAYRIETGPFGPRLVLQGAWEAEFRKVVSSRGVKELEANYAHGWEGKDLEFVRDLDALLGFVVIDWGLEDVSPVHALRKLRLLEIHTYCRTALEFSCFPELEECFLMWRPRARSLFESRSVRRLYVDRFKLKDAEGFAGMGQLESLGIANGPLESVIPLETLAELRKLRLRRLRRLRSLAGVPSGLAELEVQNCPVGSLEPLRGLRSLRHLTVADAGPIESLSPLEDLPIESLLFFGSTDIRDGDLGVLTRMPKLQTTAFAERRHYSHDSDALERAGISTTGRE